MIRISNRKMNSVSKKQLETIIEKYFKKAIECSKEHEILNVSQINTIIKKELVVTLETKSDFPQDGGKAVIYIMSRQEKEQFLKTRNSNIVVLPFDSEVKNILQKVYPLKNPLAEVPLLLNNALTFKYLHYSQGGK